MSNITALNGTVVTDEMIDAWAESLDADQWPADWVNVGEVINGQPPTPSKLSEPITTKVTPAMKAALIDEANRAGISTSDAIREALADWIIKKTA